MDIEKTEALVVGAGQAGLAMSAHLRTCGVPHLVLERHRIAERWRSERWDSLVANGPAWHDRFPDVAFADVDPDGFVPKEQVADYFVAYAERIAAPIRCGVAVEKVQRIRGGPGFRVETSQGVVEATNVIAATGPFQRPVIPAVVPDDAKLMQIHSSAYRNPAQLLEGAVLVVGAGSSGAQIADEFLRAGKLVFLLSFNDGVLRLAPDLAANLARGDSNYLSVLDEADAYLSRHGLVLPEEPDARTLAPDPPCVSAPILELNLAQAGITSIVWATGYALDYSWLEVDAFDDNGRPTHRRGVAMTPGLYFLGLPWLSKRGSAFIWGVWHDAKYLAEHIAQRREHPAYQPGGSSP